MAVKVYQIQGKFLIPGTRELGSLGPIKVIAESYQAASRSLQPMLIEKYKKELPHKHTFSPDFVLYHCQMDELKPKAKKESEVIVIPAKADCEFVYDGYNTDGDCIASK